MKHANFIIIFSLCLFLFAAIKWVEWRQAAHLREVAKGQCHSLANELASQTDSTGSFVRIKPENRIDVYGNPLVVEYEKGGTMDIVRVRSLGADGIYGTSDDIVVTKRHVCLSNVVESMKEGLK